MAKFTQNDITFSATNGMKLSGKISRSSNGDFSDVEEGIDPFVNAVEIDWNGAEVEECLLIQVGESRCSMIVPSIVA